MLKQSTLTTSMPINNLSQWNYPKESDKKIHRIEDVFANKNSSNKFNVLNESDINLIFKLEKQINFLQKEHAETLANLHGEVNKLKSQNQELQLKLVLCQDEELWVKISSDEPIKKNSALDKECQINNINRDEILLHEIKKLEEEIKDLTIQIQEERKLYKHLNEHFDHGKKTYIKEDCPKSKSNFENNIILPMIKSAHSRENPLSNSINFHIGTNEALERRVMMLTMENEKQACEIKRMKHDLREALLLNKSLISHQLPSLECIYLPTNSVHPKKKQGFTRIPGVDDRASSPVLECRYENNKPVSNNILGIKLPPMKPSENKKFRKSE